MRRRVRTLNDGTKIESRRDGDVKSRIVTSPCGVVCEDHQLMRAVTIESVRRNLYSEVK